MKSIWERFKDTRNPRKLSNARHMHADRKARSKLCVPEWRALKADKRFALCALASAYENHGTCLGQYAYGRLHAIDFARHAAIPEFAFKFAAAHPAKCDPAKIACYPTFKDAARGREIVMTAGRFFAAVFPDASPAKIQRMAEKYATAQAPASVHFASDADDFARVYASARGFSSCMGGEWEGDQDDNPVRFYAHPDNELALAYLTHNNKPGGETVARTIVNTAKKCYVRVYGDARLKDLLHAMGYDCNGNRALSGQKCHARSINDDLVAPYLDAIQTIDWDGCSDYCVISANGDWDATNTDGTASCNNRMQCDECGDRMDECDSTYIENEEIQVCEHCCNNHFTYAIIDRRGNERYIRDRDAITVGDRTYINDDNVLAAHNIVCDDNGDYQHLDDCVYLEYVGHYVLADDCTRLDIAHGDDEYARDCDTKKITIDDEEKTVHEDYCHDC